MKAHIRPTAQMQKAIDEYADKKIAEIQQAGEKAEKAVGSRKREIRHCHKSELSVLAGLLSGRAFP